MSELASAQLSQAISMVVSLCAWTHVACSCGTSCLHVLFNRSLMETSSKPQGGRVSRYPAHLRRLLHLGGLEVHGRQHPRITDQPQFPLAHAQGHRKSKPPLQHRLRQYENTILALGFQAAPDRKIYMSHRTEDYGSCLSCSSASTISNPCARDVVFCGATRWVDIGTTLKGRAMGGHSCLFGAA